VRYKPTNFDIISDDVLTIKTETGHIVKYKLETTLSTDIDNDAEGDPFYYVTINPIYIGVESPPGSLSLAKVKKQLADRNLLTPEVKYDHIQIGFVYNDKDEHQHRWMLNFMDADNNHLFNFIGDNIKVNCAFTTKSWKDDIWHGRFIVYKKDVGELVETSQGSYILTGTSNINNHNLIPLDKSIDLVSLRYDIVANTWTCDLKTKGTIVGEFLTKTLICDVPFIGAVNKAVAKPKVTAELNAIDIAGISITHKALIIKKK